MVTDDAVVLVLNEKPHNDLTQLKLAVFASCMTGMDDAAFNTNMVGVMYRKGCHFVIAHSDWTSSPCGDVWVQEFLENCKNGQTVYEAMNNADNYLYANYSWEPLFGNAIQRHVLGDNSLRLDR